MVVPFLFLTRAWFSHERPDRLGAALNTRGDEILCARCRHGEALQVSPRHRTHARHRGTLGRSCSDSNARRILPNWDRKTRRWPIAWRDGKSRRKFIRLLSAVTPLLFRHRLLQFFPWSIKLPSLTRKLWRSRDIIDTYVLTGTAIIFVIFSLIKTKLPHYP